MRILAATLLAASCLATVAATGCATGVQSDVKPAGSSVRIELPAGLGSGVYIGHGVIITAAHVVGDAPRAVIGNDQEGKPIYGPPTVKLISDLGDVQTGEVLWINKVYDIAAVRPSNAKRFTAANLACRDAIVGEGIAAEGNPVGVQFITMHGYVSGEARELQPQWKSAFVTDMTTISGMSGGPTYDEFGEVIGITVGAMDPHGEVGKAASAGMGFAVPSSVVCGLLGRS